MPFKHDNACTCTACVRLRQDAKDRARSAWVRWLSQFGIAEFYDAFMRNAQGAASECIYCRQTILLDIEEGGGVPDWKTADGDYGCSESPDTSDEGTGSHEPRRI